MTAVKEKKKAQATTPRGWLQKLKKDGVTRSRAGLTLSFDGSNPKKPRLRIEVKQKEGGSSIPWLWKAPDGTHWSIAKVIERLDKCSGGAFSKSFA